MSTLTSALIDDENPWPGLAAFDEGAERFFNGRRDETATLRRLVAQSPLAVLFAASGLGKTSLLQAGLFPALRRDHLLPVYVRLDVRDRSGRLIDQAREALRKQFEEHGVDADPPRDGESLWAYLHRRELELWSRHNQLLTPVFVFDQFEEVFTVGAENPAAIARLRVDLADLIENRLPTELVGQAGGTEDGLSLDSQRYKVILSFREDFLPAAEGWKRDIPSILRTRLRLLPMSGEQAFQAVHETGGRLVDESLARAIVRFVAAAQDDRAPALDESAPLGELAVEPALLSVVCHGLNEKRKAQQKPAFDAALLSGTGQAVILEYYRGAVADMPPRVHRFLENELITERGFRKPCDIGDARDVHGVTDAQLRALVDRRLLRIEPQRGTEHVELTHDLLTRVVREHRDRQRERARRRRVAAFAAMVIAFAALAVVFAVLWYDARDQRRIAVREKEGADEARAAAVRERAAADLERDNAVKAQQTMAETFDRLRVAESLAALEASNAARARDEGQRSAASASARRLATESLFQFDSRNLALSGALAAAAFSQDSTLEAWRALTQAVRLLLPVPEQLPPAHKRRVNAVAFSRDGRWMASAADDNTVVLWNRKDAGRRTALQIKDSPARSNSALRFSPDGEWLAVGAANSLWIWRTTGSGPPVTIRNSGMVMSVDFSPDGRRLITATQFSWRLRLFERAGESWTERTSPAPPPEAQAVEALFVTPDVVVVAGRLKADGIWMWNLADNTIRAYGSERQVDECRAAAISPDRSRLAAICGALVLRIDLDGPDVLDLEPREVPWNYSQLRLLGISEDGRYVATSDGDDVVHVQGDGLEGELSRIAGRTSALAFSPDGRTLVTGATDGSIASWSFAKGAESIRLDGTGGERGIAFSPDGSVLAAAGRDGTLKVFAVNRDGTSRQIESSLLGADIGGPVFSPDGRQLVVVGFSRVYPVQVRPWQVLTPIDVSGEEPMATFTPDGRMLLVVDGQGIRRFDAVAWREVLPAIPGRFRTVRVSPDSGMVSAATSTTPTNRRGSITLIQVWSLATGAELAWQETGRVTSDGPAARAAEGGPAELRAQSGRWAPINPRSAAAADWQLEVSNRTVELKERGRDRVVARLEHDADLMAAVIDVQGRWVATSSSDGALRLWPLDPQIVLERACTLLPRNLTEAEWATYNVGGTYRKTCPTRP